jgi:hypothetical protein
MHPSPDLPGELHDDKDLDLLYADTCYYCGEGPAGEFVNVDGQPTCDGCLDDYDALLSSADPAGDDLPF